tara:strand:+ start:244 stop:933 length:690 start_codon:yes stop_codon:yes gene_type:complete
MKEKPNGSLKTFHDNSLNTLLSKEEKHLKNLLSQQDNKSYENLIEELRDNYKKDTMFRTEVEMRFSVLNDGRHPTRGSKYWQSVKEQKTHLLSLIELSFEYRILTVEIKKTQKQIDLEEDELEKELLQIELEKKLWGKRNMEFEGGHRMRELTSWSKIKKELDDGSFNTQNVESHQLESYQKMYQNKQKSITPGTPQSSVFNIYSQLQTVTRILEEKKLENDKKDSIEQ